MTSSGPGALAEGNTWQSARDFGARLIDERKYAAAIPALRTAVAGDPGGESHALLGLAHYLNEEYAPAVIHYEEAVRRQPGSDDWSRMHVLAQSQVESETNVAVPEHYLFKREQLLAQPMVEGALPAPPPPSRPPSLFKKIRLGIGNFLGAIVANGMHFTTQLWGRIAGYRDRVWTNWYRRRMTFAILTLAYMRENLNKNNLRSTYPPGTLTGFMPTNQSPPKGVTHFRTADGSWNNCEHLTRTFRGIPGGETPTASICELLSV